MRVRDVKLFLAFFLAVFIVLSPAAHMLILSQGSMPKTDPGEKIYPLEEKYMVGQLTPNPEMQSLTGEPIYLEEFRGKTVVLYLWSTWSPTSPRGMWLMNQLHLKNEHPDLEVLAANIGFRDRFEEIKYYIKRRNLKVPIAICKPDVLAQFNVQGVPAVFIIDKEGIIRYEALGTIEDEAEFKETLEGLLKGEAVK